MDFEDGEGRLSDDVAGPPGEDVSAAAIRLTRLLDSSVKRTRLRAARALLSLHRSPGAAEAPISEDAQEKARAVLKTAGTVVTGRRKRR